MSSILSTLGGLGDLILVVLGFSLIIVIHELGHFLAARWAKIRVLAFAVGFGPALVSYRRGLPGGGWRRGSSAGEYEKLTGIDPSGAVALAAAGDGAASRGMSSTEYRLNILPFGGYVKMLGQDDANPSARSNAPDSYQNCKPWKRMIVISAGVIANLITAAALFIVVFMVGLPTEPPKIGMVVPGSPAATTVAINAAALGVTEPGLQPGDQILSIDGDAPLSFNDFVLAAAMARKGDPIRLEVDRAGVPSPLKFDVVPVEEPATKLLYVGAMSAASAKVEQFKNEAARREFAAIMKRAGVEAIEPGMTLTQVGGQPATSVYDLVRAVERSEGEPVDATFRRESGESVAIRIPAVPALERDTFPVIKGERVAARHVIGLLPVMMVENVAGDERRPSGAQKAGLQAGDVFVQLGEVEWPSGPAGMREIKSRKGGQIRVVVTRPEESGVWREHDLGMADVDSGGRLGFAPGDTALIGSWVGAPAPSGHEASVKPSIRLAPGSRIVAVDETPVKTLGEVRIALGRLAAEGKREVPLRIELPMRSAGEPPTETVALVLSNEDVRTLAASSWEPALDPGWFEPEQFELVASGPVEAIRMGIEETHRVMMTTYITFARLFQGSVKVSHLKGPVGIAHVGTLLADRGFIWLLFFMALISVNLAVINFLPIPIADGGHFVFLLYEQITGKPVSVMVQNVAAIAGLILLAGVFLIVTFNDIANLFRG